MYYVFSEYKNYFKLSFLIDALLLTFFCIELFYYHKCSMIILGCFFGYGLVNLRVFYDARKYLKKHKYHLNYIRDYIRHADMTLLQASLHSKQELAYHVSSILKCDYFENLNRIKYTIEDELKLKNLKNLSYETYKKYSQMYRSLRMFGNIT